MKGESEIEEKKKTEETIGGERITRCLEEKKRKQRWPKIRKKKQEKDTKRQQRIMVKGSRERRRVDRNRISNSKRN